MIVLTDSLGNRWTVFRSRGGKLVVIEVDRANAPDDPVYAAIPVGDVDTLADTLRRARDGEGGAQ